MTVGVVPQVKYPYKGGERWSFFVWRDIADNRREDLVYLRRFIIVKCPWFAVYLHRIYLPDSDRWPHNHPFAFYSIVLSGMYEEERMLPGGLPMWRRRRRWSIAKTNLNDFHRIRMLKGEVRTLVLCGPRTQNWGFLTEDGYVQWDEVKSK